MKRHREHKSKNTFSRFATLSVLSWLLITLILCAAFFYYYFELNFKTNFTTINSYLVIFQKRELILYSASAFSALTLLTVYIRIFAFRTFTTIKFVLSLIPTLFLVSLLILSYNIYSVIITLNIPFHEGIFALKRYLESFSTQNILIAINSLPYQLNSIKIPLYGLIYSYIAMISIIIIFPLQLSLKIQSVWKILNIILCILFISLFAYSVYYLTQHFILNDPFVPYEQLLEILNTP